MVKRKKKKLFILNNTHKSYKCILQKSNSFFFISPPIFVKYYIAHILTDFTITKSFKYVNHKGLQSSEENVIPC